MLESLPNTKVAEYLIRSVFFPPDISNDYNGTGNGTLVGLHRPQTLFDINRMAEQFSYALCSYARVMELTVHKSETYVTSFKTYQSLWFITTGL